MLPAVKLHLLWIAIFMPIASFGQNEDVQPVFQFTNGSSLEFSHRGLLYHNKQGGSAWLLTDPIRFGESTQVAISPEYQDYGEGERHVVVAGAAASPITFVMTAKQEVFAVTQQGEVQKILELPDQIFKPDPLVVEHEGSIFRFLTLKIGASGQSAIQVFRFKNGKTESQRTHGGYLVADQLYVHQAVVQGRLTLHLHLPGEDPSMSRSFYPEDFELGLENAIQKYRAAAGPDGLLPWKNLLDLRNSRFFIPNLFLKTTERFTPDEERHWLVKLARAARQTERREQPYSIFPELSAVDALKFQRIFFYQLLPHPVSNHFIRVQPATGSDDAEEYVSDALLVRDKLEHTGMFFLVPRSKKKFSLIYIRKGAQRYLEDLISGCERHFLDQNP